jgi:hypothetical protein
MDEQKEVFHSKKKTFATAMILTFLLCGKLICLSYAFEFFPTCPSYKSSDVRIKCMPFKHFMHVWEIQLYTFHEVKQIFMNFWLKGPAFA